MPDILRSPWLRAAIAIILILLFAVGYYTWHWIGPSTARSANVITWIRDPQSHTEWAMQPGERCGSAPFQLPTYGMVGYLWNDTFKIGHRHQGIDIFGGTVPGETPVFAAYDGFLTRLPDWKSSVIIRVPSDPLQPGRQIWIYYTHMADPQGNSFISTQYPPDTVDEPVKAGDLLGYQGNYSGDPANPVGVHLHFSIVLDNGQGRFRNELEIRNTLDPSPYLGMGLNADRNHGEVPGCNP